MTEHLTIVVPTRGRVGRQFTLRALAGLPAPGRDWEPDDPRKTLPPSQLLAQTILVCPRGEAPGHLAEFKGSGLRIWPQPDPDMTITKKRAWIMEECVRKGIEKILMLDDDMGFMARPDDTPRDAPRLKVVKDWRQLQDYFDKMAAQLGPEMPHAGFGARMGNDKQPFGWVGPGRVMLALGYYLPTVLEHTELGRIETREDMDVCLQLLRAGFTNKILHELAVSPATYGAEGGCSGQRTTESSNADAYRLAELHPGLVSVVDKNYKNEPRKEVVCRWKKALEQGLARRAATTQGALSGAPDAGNGEAVPT